MARKLLNIEEELDGSQGLSYEYIEQTDSYSVNGIGSCKDEEIRIPGIYDGRLVTRIKGGSLAGTSVKKVFIPDSVDTVDNFIFRGCESLEAIIVSEESKSYKDIDGVLYTKGGDELVFYPNGKEERTLVIPEGVVTIKTGALSGKRLSRIEVDPKNTQYKAIDGNLYSKDGASIIRYASGKSDDTFELPRTVATVCAGAFADSDRLRRVILHPSVKMVEKNAFVGSQRVVAYCKIKKQPSEWEEGWSRDANVVWNFGSKAKKIKSYQKMEEKKEKHHKSWLTFKTVLFSLPVVVAVLVALDIFNEAHGHMKKIRGMAGFDTDLMIIFFAVFAAGCVATTATFIAKMWVNEKRRGQYNYSRRAYNIGALVVTLIMAVIVGLNLRIPLAHLSDSKVKLTGGNYDIIEYLAPDSTYVFPSTSKDEDVHEEYVTRYTFSHWEIDGKSYAVGQSFIPDGWVRGKAVFTEVDWCTLTVSVSGASISVSYDDVTYGPYSYGTTVDIPRGKSVTVSAAFSYSDTSFSVGGMTASNPHTFTIEKHTSVSASSTDPGCLAEGTQVMLADGTYKDISQLEKGDVLMIFNHETGEYDKAPLLVNVHASTPAREYNVMTLNFSDGGSIRFVDAHGLFDKTLNGYVQITEENYSDFIGHSFVSSRLENGEMTSCEVELLSVDVTKENVKIYNPVSLWHLNLVADGMLTMSSCVVDIFEYDENMRYDTAALERDIAEYGLYSYEELQYFITPEEYTYFPFMYYKIAVGKGLYTEQQLIGVVDLYHQKDSVNGIE